MDDRNIEEAENWFKRAVHLKHDFRSALFNLALLLADDHRPLEAAPFLNQLVKHHPDHIKGLILLGDIYINNIKDLDAAENVSFFFVVFVFPDIFIYYTFSSFFLLTIYSVINVYCNSTPSIYKDYIIYVLFM